MTERRVLHVITRGELGGAQRYVEELAFRQRICGFNVGLLTGTAGWLTERASSFESVTVVRNLVRDLSATRDPAALREIRTVLTKNRWDVVHTHSSKAGVLGRLAARSAGVDVVAHTSHGSPIAEPQSWARHALYVGMEQLAALVTDRLFAVSDTERRLLLSALRIAPQRVRVMTLIPRYIKALTLRWHVVESRRWELLAVGNLYRTKGYEVLLASLARLVKQFPFIRLTIVGDGPERSALLTTAANLGVLDRLTLPGVLPDAHELMAGAGIIVSASRKEGLPLSLLEAMATGCPIVTTSVGSIPEILGADYPALVPAGDSEALSTRLAEVLSDDAVRAELGRRARKRYELVVERDAVEVCDMYA